jgi:hypothetical protein
MSKRDVTNEIVTFIVTPNTSDELRAAAIACAAHATDRDDLEELLDMLGLHE